jgi:hypothetical protein
MQQNTATEADFRGVHGRLWRVHLLWLHTASVSSLFADVGF